MKWKMSLLTCLQECVLKRCSLCALRGWIYFLFFFFCPLFWTNSSPSGDSGSLEGEPLQHSQLWQMHRCKAPWVLDHCGPLSCASAGVSVHLVLAAVPHCLDMRANKLLHAAVCFPCGIKLASRAAAARWKISIWWLCSDGLQVQHLQPCLHMCGILYVFSKTNKKNLDCSCIYFCALMVD